MATKDLLGSLAGAAVKAATSKPSETEAKSSSSALKDTLTAAAMQAITSQITSKAKGLSESGLDLNNIVTTLVGACSKSNIDYTKIAGAIANIWNTAYKAGGGK